ncbi:MAG: hypothetical protein SCM11_04385 [Bacillota bacterium]|nr:hypothetical protein [Bacillota bacterium]
MLGLDQLSDRLYFNSLLRLGRLMVRQDGAKENIRPYYGYYQMCHRIIGQRLHKEVTGYLLSSQPPFTLSGRDSSETLFSMGLACERGWMIQPDPVEAVKCFQSSASLGNATALYRIGFVCEQNLDLISRFGSPEFHYAKAAEQGVPEAWVALGQIKLFQELQQSMKSEKKLNGPFDPDQFIEPFLQAERLGWTDRPDYLWFLRMYTSQYESDDSFISIRNIEDHFYNDLKVYHSEMRDRFYWYNCSDEITLRLARFLSTTGNVYASIFISWCYLNGRMLPQKFDMALRWALDAAKGNNAKAIHYLGWVCLHGADERYGEKAFEYLAKAASLSYEPAIHDERLLRDIGITTPNQLWLYRHNLPDTIMWYTEFAVIDDFSNHQETLDNDVN